MDKKDRGRERKTFASFNTKSHCNQVLRTDEVHKFVDLMKTVAVNIINLQLF